MSDATLTYGAIFLGLCVLGHLFIRARLPDADPYLFPLAALLAAVGLVLIYRIDPELAREQAQWFVTGLALFCATIMLVRDHHVLERYRYTIAAVGIALLVMPRLPGSAIRSTGRPRDQARPGPVPAGRVRQARDHRLPRELPARHGGHPGAPAAADRCRPLARCCSTASRRWRRVLAILVLELGTAGSLLLLGSSRPRWSRCCATGPRPSTSARCCSSGGWRC